MARVDASHDGDDGIVINNYTLPSFQLYFLSVFSPLSSSSSPVVLMLTAQGLRRRSRLGRSWRLSPAEFLSFFLSVPTTDNSCLNSCSTRRFLLIRSVVYWRLLLFTRSHCLTDATRCLFACFQYGCRGCSRHAGFARGGPAATTTSEEAEGCREKTRWVFDEREVAVGLLGWLADGLQRGSPVNCSRCWVNEHHPSPSMKTDTRDDRNG